MYMYIYVRMFAQICEGALSHHTLCTYEIWSGSNNCVYHIFHVGKKKKDLEKKIYTKIHHHTDFEADLWPETGAFFGGALSLL